MGILKAMIKIAEDMTGVKPSKKKGSLVKKLCGSKATTKKPAAKKAPAKKPTAKKAAKKPVVVKKTSKK